MTGNLDPPMCYSFSYHKIYFGVPYYPYNVLAGSQSSALPTPPRTSLTPHCLAASTRLVRSAWPSL